MTDDTRKEEAGNDNTVLSSVIRRPPTEIGGPKGPEPTRYGDWEHKGKCVDF